ncbi:hypothetical protein GCM10027517_30760 [Phycicoccus ginsengisoli]
MALSLRRRPRLAAGVRSALELSDGERVLSWGLEEATGTTVVATNHRLYAVPAAAALGPIAGGGATGADLGAGAVGVVRRPWHEVDAGTWSSDLGQLTVTWVDGARPSQWTLGVTSLVPETVRERVQASVVVSHRVDLGRRRTARAVIRQDLGSGALVEQVLLGKGTPATDTEVSQAAEQAISYLREQVGLE